VLVGSADPFPAVSLAEVLDRAELQTRVDRKYLLPADVFAAFRAGLAGSGQWAALEIDGRREFRYDSTYFDTPDLLTYRQHRQDRRRRFKIRTRSYLDSATSLFEVKLSGTRRGTVKERTPHPFERRGELTAPARAFLTAVLEDAYGEPPPAGLRPAATTRYLRRTLVARTGACRVTCDTGLVCTTAGARVAAVPEWVLVEVKSPGGDTPADRLLRALGARPERLSKYCLAAAVLTPGLACNPWNRPLRRWFGAAAPR
jgi:hypothetical protein